MIDDVILNKTSSIVRCFNRIEEDFDDEFETNYTKQDAVTLNIQRAIQQTIDLGAYLVKKYKLGIPKTTKDIFIFLSQKGIISKELSNNLQKMLGFRNVAIHEYTQLKIEILEDIIKNHIFDVITFKNGILEYEKAQNEKSND